MPLLFQYKTDEGPTRIEITDDGAMVFLDYDIEADIMALELGDHPSKAMQLLMEWQTRPASTLLDMSAASGPKKREVYSEIGETWILNTIGFLRGIKDSVGDYQGGYERQLERLEEYVRTDEIKSKEDWKDMITFVTYDDLGRQIFPEISKSLRSLSKIKNDKKPYYLAVTRELYNRLIRTVRGWCDKEKVDELRHIMLLEAIDILEQHQ